MWKLQEALELLRQLEPLAVEKGYHVALGGGVMLRGESDNDLDIILYHHTDKDKQVSYCSPEDFCRQVLEGMDFFPCNPFNKDGAGSGGGPCWEVLPGYKTVIRTNYHRPQDGSGSARVDFIFLHHP